MQKLSGCLAALSRFISKLAERALPFFKFLCTSRPFVWTPEVERAFQELKRYLTSTPVLVVPEPSEPLLLYISTTEEVVSMVLIVERAEPLKEGSGSQGPPEDLQSDNAGRDPRVPEA